MDREIIVVSGLPRSGTSLMMQMLHAGGLEVATDQLRSPDDDNPLGYYEFEPVKRLQQESSWIPEARGKAIKVISQLMFALPTTERYAVVLMQRDLEEVLTSQETMLLRQGRAAGAREVLRKAFATHLERLETWLPQQSHIRVLRLSYADVVRAPLAAAERIHAFIGATLNATAMAEAVDPSLYRNRSASSDS